MLFSSLSKQANDVKVIDFWLVNKATKSAELLSYSKGLWTNHLQISAIWMVDQSTIWNFYLLFLEQYTLWPI